MSGSTVTGIISVGITLGAGNYLSPLTITSTGHVYPGGSGTTGINFGFNGGYILNEGTVSGGPNGGIGVQMFTGTLGNKGYVTGGYSGSSGYGVELFGGTVMNAGTIIAGGMFQSAILQEGGVVINNGVVIGNGRYGDQINAGTLINYGTLKGGANHNNGLFVGGGTVINDSIIQGVSLDGGAFLNNGTVTGVESRYGATFTNAGYISVGSNGDAVLFGTGASRLIIDPGASFGGRVVASGLSSKQAIELTAGKSTGTLSGIGGQFSGFGNIEIDTGASWVISGNTAGLANGQVISGFGEGDTIVLNGFSTSTYSFVPGTGLQLSGSGGTVTLDLTGSFQSSNFLVADQGTSTAIVENVLCFLEGTRIATPTGEVLVEDLEIGDQLRTLHAGVQKIRWIGRQSYDGRFIAGNREALPVCIKADAISDSVPACDLWVSPGHAICIDGTLVHASHLINDVSIIQAEHVESVSYYNIELESHEIIFAENCPAESFIGERFRGHFHNAASYRTLYPQGCVPEHSCLPLLESGFQLEAIKRRLAARAGIAIRSATGALRRYLEQAGPDICAGWAQDDAAPEMPVCMDIFSEGQRIGRVLANSFRGDVRDAGYGSGYHGFSFQIPEGTTMPIEIRRSTDGSKLTVIAPTSSLAA